MKPYKIYSTFVWKILLAAIEWKPVKITSNILVDVFFFFFFFFLFFLLLFLCVSFCFVCVCLFYFSSNSYGNPVNFHLVVPF